MNNAPFEIGQKVVAIETHSQEYYSKGNVFLVTGIRPTFCRCAGWDISIGIISNRHYMGCEDCGLHGVPNNTGLAWFGYMAFAPIEENTYENISKELAVLPQDEVPDVKTIKELVN